MRRHPIIICVVLALFAAPNRAGADPIDKPVAIVKLYETEAISQSQLKITVAAMEKSIGRQLTTEEKLKLLDNLISEKLIIQAANKEKIHVTDTEVEQYKNQTKKLYEERLGRPMTDDEFRTMISQTGYQWDTFLAEIKKMLMEQKYIKNHKGNLLTNVPDPSDKEIMDYFYKNQSRLFVSPAIVRFKQIYINPNLLSTPAEKAKAKKKAEAINREIKAGASFDNYWQVYDDSGSTKIGNLINGSLRRDDEQSAKVFGDDFFNSVFTLKQGEVSGVISSKIGYHIVMVLEKFPPKLLDIDDLIPPQNSMTVRNYIKAILGKVKEQEALKKALDEIVADLEKTADIKKFPEYLNW
ncbi:MAG: SurA N-terminal domain-containing protein [Spirochaetales bacterium]|nr:SurA N-terminal domain-containing protein [Spirochaetales bacterium]